MALEDSINKLKSISDEAKSLFTQMKALADLGKNAKDAQKSKIMALANKLNVAANTAGRERLEKRLQELDKKITDLNLILQVDLSPSARNDVRGELIKTRALSARLNAKRGLDFSGMLTSREVNSLVVLSRKTSRDAARKMKAAAFLASAVKIADLSLSIAAKLAA